MSGSLGESQKEGQEDQGGIKEAVGTPPGCFKVPWSSWSSALPSFTLPSPSIPEIAPKPKPYGTELVRTTLSIYLIYDYVLYYVMYERTDCKMRWFDGLSESPGTNQKEGIVQIESLGKLGSLEQAVI